MNWRDVGFIILVIASLNGAHQWGRYEGARDAKKQMRLVVSGYVNGALDEYYKRSARPPFGNPGLVHSQDGTTERQPEPRDALKHTPRNSSEGEG